METKLRKKIREIVELANIICENPVGFVYSIKSDSDFQTLNPKKKASKRFFKAHHEGDNKSEWLIVLDIFTPNSEMFPPN